MNNDKYTTYQNLWNTAKATDLKYFGLKYTHIIFIYKTSLKAISANSI